MACHRLDTSVASMVHLSRTSAMFCSSFFNAVISCLRIVFVQQRHTNGSSLFERVLYRLGGTLAQPLWNQRPHSPSHSKASSFPSVIAPWQTPQGTFPRLEGFFGIGPEAIVGGILQLATHHNSKKKFRASLFPANRISNLDMLLSVALSYMHQNF